LVAGDLVVGYIKDVHNEILHAVGAVQNAVLDHQCSLIAECGRRLVGVIITEKALPHRTDRHD
jgi:hypothetical protein